MINQLSYYSPDTVTGGALGLDLLVTVVSLDGDFCDNGAKLKDNATGRGDVTVGPQVQFDPIIDAAVGRFSCSAWPSTSFCQRASTTNTKT